MRIEIVPMLMNICITLYYLHKGDELGHVVYWFGAAIITVGLYMMRG